MENMACAEVEIDASSGSVAALHAELINAEASSDAKIRVYGVQEQIEIEISSGGNVGFLQRGSTFTKYERRSNDKRMATP